MGAHLVVDGHNLLRSGALPLTEDPGTAGGRDALCALLAAYARRKGFRLTVVFDGRGSGRPDRARAAFKGGTALYSSRSETADDVIRELARGAPAGTFVVTSDRGLAGTLSGRGIAVVSCDDFAARVFDSWLAGVKGAPEEEAPPPGGPAKKGEGHRAKKRERERDRRLRKL